MDRIKKAIVSASFFAISIFCFYTIFRIMAGYYQFNQVTIFIASLLGVIFLYISIHVLK